MINFLNVMHVCDATFAPQLKLSNDISSLRLWKFFFCNLFETHFSKDIFINYIDNWFRNWKPLFPKDDILFAGDAATTIKECFDEFN